MSQLQGRFRLASQDIVCEEFDGEMVILNLASGHYFALNKSGSILLQHLLHGHAAEEICSITGAHCTSNDAHHIFHQLLDYALIVADSSQPPAPLTSTSREAVAALIDKPTLEVHDDLADLIIADPIHDSDATVGWPVQKAA